MSNINKIQEWVKKLAHCKEDIVFVGSVSEGKINPNDIDIAVTSTEGLHQFGKIEYWKTNATKLERLKKNYIQKRLFSKN